MRIHQLRSTDGTGTLTYVLVDDRTGAGAIVDPNFSDYDRIVDLVRRAGITLTRIIDTHTHVDHISGAGALRERFGAETIMHEKTKDKWKIVEQGDKFGIGDTLRANANIPVDRYVTDGDSIPVGGTSLRVLYTPGHTDNHIALQMGDALFVGDLILAGQAGRCDLPGGDALEQYISLFSKVLPLPDNTKLFPGHDYENNTFVLLGDEKRTNPFLQQRTSEEYLEFVKDYFPPIAEAGPGGHVTLQCGAARVVRPDDPFKSMTATTLASAIEQGTPVMLLDVREPMELVMDGAIPGVVNIPMRDLVSRINELPSDTKAMIVAVCRSGNRSAEAAHYLATHHGYTNVFNLEGGIIAWKLAGSRVEHAVSGS